MTETHDRASGSLFGLALGDALGAKTEFLSVYEIRQRFGAGGPAEPPGDPARVTDDTQMTLAVGEALLEAGQPLSASTLEEPLRRAFVAWADSPDNDRAPGMTCLTACARLKLGMPWTQATVADSKGCGANMRVAPVGLVPNIAPQTRAALAQFQAALTHGHPTALAASDLTAWTVADLMPPAATPARCRAGRATMPGRSAPSTTPTGLVRSGSARSRHPLLSSSRAAGTSAWASWTAWMWRSQRRIANIIPAASPEKAGSPRKPLRRACSASCCFPTTPSPPSAEPPSPPATPTQLPASPGPSPVPATASPPGPPTG